MSDTPIQRHRQGVEVAVIWIDWYVYHVARFRGLNSAPALHGKVAGIELVGGVGVHQGLKFREDLPADLPVITLLPEASWNKVSKWTLSRLLWQHLNELNPRVVLVPGYYTLPGITAALWARLHGRLSVLMTESTAGDHARTWWKELPKRLALRALFSWAVCGGQAHVRYLRQLGFPAKHIAGGYDVVDNAFFHQGVTRERDAGNPAPAPAPYFLYVGRLAPEKNVDGLLQSWIRYREAGGTWPLVLCGDGPERAQLEQAASATPFGADVYFPGLKTSHALLPFYAHAGCFVLPSTREPWGLVVNEAMAAGLPVLVSARCGCVEDLVKDGENGFAFNPDDQLGMMQLLQRMEATPPAEREEMGKQSLEIVARYSPEVFGASVARIAASAGTARPDGAWAAAGEGSR